MSVLERFLESRWKLLQDANPPEHGETGWRAILSPELDIRLRAETDGSSLINRYGDQAPTIAGIPFTVSHNLPPHHLGIIFCGLEPFDSQHPERTVVITKGEE